MSEASDMAPLATRPGRRFIRWLGAAGLVATVFAIQYFWSLRDLPDQLGTIFYNAYLGEDEGLRGALEDLNSLSTYYEGTADEGRPRAVPTGFRFSIEGDALVVINRSMNSWVAGRIISRVTSGAQLRSDVGPKATEGLRRKSWRDTSRELRRFGLTFLILRNEDGDSWQTQLP